MKRVVVALALCAIALAADAVWVALKTRPAAPRDGGAIFDTPVVPANVRIEDPGNEMLLHGFEAALRLVDGIRARANANHRVVRLDLIGHGGTEGARTGYTIVRQAELASAILDKLGVERVTVIAPLDGRRGGGGARWDEAGRRAHDPDGQATPAAGTTFTMLTEAYLAPGLGELLSTLRSDAAIRRGLAQDAHRTFQCPRS